MCSTFTNTLKVSAIKMNEPRPLEKIQANVAMGMDGPRPVGNSEAYADMGMDEPSIMEKVQANVGMEIYEPRPVGNSQVCWHGNGRKISTWRSLKLMLVWEWTKYVH